ncbi:glycosyltransferase [Coraliomargarita sp. W4R53]
MNILITTEALSSEIGGPYYTINALAGVLAARGHAVTLLYLDIGDEPNLLKPDAVDEVVVPAYRKRILGQNFAWGLKRRILSEIKLREIDVMIDNGIWLFNNYQSVMAAKLAQIPIVVAPRGLLESGAMQYRSLKKKIAWCCYQRRALQQVDMFHACSPKEVDSIRALGFDQPVALVPNGVNLPTLDHVARADVQQERCALFLSRVHETKGVIELVESWARVKPLGWVLNIAGTGPSEYRMKLAAKILELKMSASIRLTGPLYGEDKCKAFESAELFILPTYTENFGVVVAEAMSYGLPVITTTGAPWAVLNEKKIGWWIHLEPDCLDSAIQTATNLSRYELRAMGGRGRSEIESDFTWEASGNSMERYLKSLITDYANNC